mmetsp:Transcript_23436/g.55526  ORF Transcript_23436/g.55526 Transcript_23436/m.55526 type:complete len:196 (+) Transcript_23436:33-620(+)
MTSAAISPFHSFILVFVAAVVCSFAVSAPTAASATSDGVAEHGITHPKTECFGIHGNDENKFLCVGSDNIKSTYTCEDLKVDECKEWAERGECSKNPQYMKVHCRKSCSTCVSLHHSDVPQIAPDEKSMLQVLQRLYETQEYIHQQADKNWEVLHRCLNKHEECTYWSLRGACSTNSGFMTKECSPACQTCHMIL